MLLEENNLLQCGKGNNCRLFSCNSRLMVFFSLTCMTWTLYVYQKDYCHLHNIYFSFSISVLSNQSDSSPFGKLFVAFYVFMDWIFDKFSPLYISLYHFSSAEVDTWVPPHFLILLTVAKSATETTAAFHPPSISESNVCHLDDLDDSDFQISAPCFQRYSTL